MSKYTKNAVFKKIQTIILNNDDTLKDKITLDSDLNDDLGLDSLDTTDIIMHIEKEFGISISDMDAEKIHTIGQLVEYVYKKI